MLRGPCRGFDPAALAFREKHFAANEPMPFILDDILINCDDARSKATLEVLAQLSAQSQVIFFSHHTHWSDLPRARSIRGSFTSRPLGG